MSINRLFNRNPFGDQPPRDAEVIRRATAIKIELYADRDGDLHGEVRLTCGWGMFGASEEDFDGSQQAASLAFVRKLLDAFQEKRRPDDLEAAG